MEESSSTGSGNQDVTPLPAHDDCVVQGLADGHVAVIGHPCEDEDLYAPKEVHGKELCHAAIVGKGLLFCQQVND